MHLATQTWIVRLCLPGLSNWMESPGEPLAAEWPSPRAGKPPLGKTGTQRKTATPPSREEAKKV